MGFYRNMVPQAPPPPANALTNTRSPALRAFGMGGVDLVHHISIELHFYPPQIVLNLRGVYNGESTLTCSPLMCSMPYHC